MKISGIGRKALRIAILLSVPLVSIAGYVALETASMSKARPPAAVRTLEDFLDWKGEAVIGKGTFVSSGTTYTVLLGEPARYLASGPSAYLFDTNGNFVDYTADMGDFYTVKHRFDLTSGNVTNLKREKP